MVFYKFTRYHLEQSTNNDNPIVVTLKLSLQFIFGAIISLPFKLIFLKSYQQSSPFIRVILSCSLIAVFYVPKLMIISNVITNLHGIYKPNESIVFASGFLVISVMVTRLTQAKIESLPLIMIVILVHGLFNVIDKLILPLRHKLCKFVCKRRLNSSSESLLFAQHYTAHQSLISIIIETTSVIMSNAAAYLLVYYYKKEESTGERYNGWLLFKEMVVRLSIAVGIEWFFNIIALKIQK